jgi:SynChlorMet cassette protein ScmC
LQDHSAQDREAVFFAAYIGPSMIPTLREPEIMEIRPYGRSPLRVGDVIFFLSPDTEQPVVHRVVRVTPDGISTSGDNNTREDLFLLQPGSVKGRVAAARRGQKRRTIRGGRAGRLTIRWLAWRRVLDRGVSFLLHPIYHALSHSGVFARALPPSLRPRVVVFQARGREQFQLLLGRRIIGRYDDYRRQWQIQRPFQILIDARTLPGRQDKEPANRRVSCQRPRAVNPPMAQEVLYRLVLADGTRWEIAAGDENAAAIVSQLGETMKLGLDFDANLLADRGDPCRLFVRVDAQSSAAECYVPLASENNGVVVCDLSPSADWGGPHVNMVRLSLVFAREAQARGGVLIHGALAERDGMGAILAAPGGTGKTTASNRLPSPWRSLCDDTTLVVRDPHGSYWAHPWPTWSRFLDGGAGGEWDVQHAVPVKGIFFLSQAVADRAESVGAGRAVSLLGECAGQVSTFMAPGLWKNELHTLYLERFDNLCGLARTVPAHLLHISLNGSFWQEIERALAETREVHASAG